MTTVAPRMVLAWTAACFVFLAAGALVFGALPADTAVREAVLGLAAPWVVGVMRIANRAGDWRVLLPGTLLLFVAFPRARARWWVWAGLMVSAPLVEWTLKHGVARARPEDASFGFPSGHATAAAAFFGAVIYLARELPPAPRALVRGLAVIGIVLVAVARVVLRAHWPSDALAGIALGLALASAAALLAAAQPHGGPRNGPPSSPTLTGLP
jgi:undecaprenyl-diphosphatase